MTNSELSMRDVLQDPLIRQVLRADHISLAKFAAILQEAARKSQQGYTFAKVKVARKEKVVHAARGLRPTL